jgi:predicted RNase H-like HicB family nuclease
MLNMLNTGAKEKIVTVIYEPAEEGGYVVYAPSLQGCYSQGETIEEATKNIKEAIELYLEDSKEETLPLLNPLMGSVSVYA